MSSDHQPVTRPKRTIQVMYSQHAGRWTATSPQISYFIVSDTNIHTLKLLVSAKLDEWLDPEVLVQHIEE